jgi:hypothetical protein
MAPFGKRSPCIERYICTLSLGVKIGNDKTGSCHRTGFIILFNSRGAIMIE